ncbi:Hypothetical predicted protein [Marmota monax]|uniref:Uncharacterized protein n=1 Tax=Marmota monax TaxID=9995 RepID=A0A5E4A902_MARMO|nr:Hypothetical predicted protein [Marmota monax]
MWPRAALLLLPCLLQEGGQAAPSDRKFIENHPQRELFPLESLLPSMRFEFGYWSRGDGACGVQNQRAVVLLVTVLSLADTHSMMRMSNKEEDVMVLEESSDRQESPPCSPPPHPVNATPAVKENLSPPLAGHAATPAQAPDQAMSFSLSIQVTSTERPAEPPSVPSPGCLDSSKFA